MKQLLGGGKVRFASQLRSQCLAVHLTRMESAVSALVNNVSSLVSNNVSNFNESRVAGRAAITGNDVASNTIMEFNAAALMADFRHVEKTLFALQRNLDDFYFVILTVITFGRIF